MTNFKMIAIALLAITSLFAHAQKSQKGFQFADKPAQKQVDVLYNGKLLTAYCYYDSVFKPVLFPVNTLDGITVTRGYPLQPRTGERTDHPHHIGIWMNYESVNGLDFWNNSTAIAADKKPNYGNIKHEKIISKKTTGNTAVLVATAGWFTNEGKKLLNEKTTYTFLVKDNQFFIERSSTLTALNEQVVFKDVKDGFFAIRVARELEMPSKEPAVFVDAQGNATKVDPSKDNISNGMYYNSNGVKGDAVWSSQARWATLKGKKDGSLVTIGMFDHPSNVGYPTYWHARGYGLFALNPLGRKVFSNGKEELNFSLSPGKSTTFKYKILIAGADVSDKEMNNIADEFAGNRN